jgi:dihydroxy-acid dehydratase
VTIDVAARRLDVDLPDDEIARRVAAYRAPRNGVESGVLSKYAKLVSGASEGAVTR